MRVIFEWLGLKTNQDFGGGAFNSSDESCLTFANESRCVRLMLLARAECTLPVRRHCWLRCARVCCHLEDSLKSTSKGELNGASAVYVIAFTRSTTQRQRDWKIGTT